MEKLYIDTSQNVVIEHNIASIGERMLAHMLDYAFFFGYFISVFTIAGMLHITESTAFAVIIFIPLLLYDMVFEYIYHGQSLGKKIIRIKAVKLDGSPAAFSNYLIRWIFRVVDNLLLFGSISTFTIISNGKGQRLGDLAAGTTVIRVGRRVSLKDALYVVLPPNYKPVYAQVKHLNEKDISTVKQVIDYYRRNTYTFNNSFFATRTKNAIEKKLNIKSDKPPLYFFQIILMDYHYFNKQ